MSCFLRLHQKKMVSSVVFAYMQCILCICICICRGSVMTKKAAGGLKQWCSLFKVSSHLHCSCSNAPPPSLAQNSHELSKPATPTVRMNSCWPPFRSFSNQSRVLLDSQKESKSINNFPFSSLSINPSRLDSLFPLVPFSFLLVTTCHFPHHTFWQ